MPPLGVEVCFLSLFLLRVKMLPLPRLLSLGFLSPSLGDVFEEEVVGDW